MNNLTKNVLLAIPASKYVNDTSRDYGIYVCETRGLPFVWDGLKDGQRKALYLLQRRAGEIKTISLAGEMISSGLYIHGDAAAADSIGKLAAPYQNNLPLITGVGTFGTRINPMDVAAPRYTYVKRNNVTENIMYVDADVVPMAENYDGSAFSPKHFLPIIPTVLLNGVSGMAPGFSTEILPRSIDDLIQATQDVLDLKMPTTLAPRYDYCDGEVLNLGPNKWAFYGTCDVVSNHVVRITGLCPGLLHEKFIETLESMLDDKSIRDYLDDTKDVVDITVRFDRNGCTKVDQDTGVLRKWTEREACEFFGLVFRTTERITVLDWDGKTVKPYNSPEELLIHFVQRRFQFYVKRFEKLLLDDGKKLDFQKLMKECFDSNLPAKLPKLNNKAEVLEAITAIAKKAKLDTNQDILERIASLPSYRWTKDEYQKVTDRIEELEENIDTYKEMLADDENIWTVYRTEVSDLKNIKFDLTR